MVTILFLGGCTLGFSTGMRSRFRGNQYSRWGRSWVGEGTEGVRGARDCPPEQAVRAGPGLDGGWETIKGAGLASRVQSDFLGKRITIEVQFG